LIRPNSASAWSKAERNPAFCASACWTAYSWPGPASRPRGAARCHRPSAATSRQVRSCRGRPPSPCGSPWRRSLAWRLGAPDRGCPNPAPARAHTPRRLRRAALVLGERHPRSPTPRGSGCSGIGRGVGFAYRWCPLANAPVRNPLRILSASLRAHVPFPTSQAPRRTLFAASTSAAATPARQTAVSFPSSRCQHSVVCYTSDFLVPMLP